MTTSSNPIIIKQPSPPCRRLRVFAFDPLLSRQIDTYQTNEVVIKLPWEPDLSMGPIDNYIEVVDYDPASQAFYPPVDLQDQKLVAQDGLPPSETNPQFHQQMTYAVARTTVKCFEQALGRKILWSGSYLGKRGKENSDEFVERLRVYPHALREANAYYSPEKKALLFGYFPASSRQSGQNMPGETVFACLSHDIIAHEVTHAIIDGLHPRFIEPSNVDAWALHEAISDLVALFQHFSYPEVLKQQIANTRGDLESQNMLGELAYQFGQAIERYGALRSAIGEIDPETKKWKPATPNPKAVQTETEPHNRGAILIAAIFDAFLMIYKSRIQDLLRIASGGTGILQPGKLHPDLVERLTEEAAKTAKHILQICIRALDYCPCVDNEFGDYLRALITADVELVSGDPHNYRLAIIEAFRRRGIYPRDVRNMTVESLRWLQPNEREQEAFKTVFASPESLKELISNQYERSTRREIFQQAKEARKTLHKWFTELGGTQAAEAAHLIVDKTKDSIYRNEHGLPFIEVHSVRPARRIGPDGQVTEELVIEITQRRRGYYDEDTQAQVDAGKLEPPEPDFIFRGGCTLLVDINTADVNYCIYKNLRSENRMKRMRAFLKSGFDSSLHATYFGDSSKEYYRQLTRKAEGMFPLEPFAFLHRAGFKEESQ